MLKRPILLAVLLLCSSLAVSQSCTTERRDEVAGIHVVVESCSSIGTFSIGGLYNGNWEKLTYQYPQPWRGSFSTFKVDDQYFCTSDNPKNCTSMDGYIRQKPTVEGGSIRTSWAIPNASVSQEFIPSKNKTAIRYTVRNTDLKNHTFDIRVHIDTMLGTNDGAPIYIPGDGLKTTETDYFGDRLDFEYWKAYNRPEEPTIVSMGNIDPKDEMTYPDRVVVADWKRSKDSAWDYSPQGRTITGDSAVISYYSLGVVAPGEERTVVVGYGSETPVLRTEKSPIGLAEITLSSVSGQYCPNDDVEFKVDVLSTNVPRGGSVGLSIEFNNTVVYENVTKTTFPKDQVKTLLYRWTIPEGPSDRSYSVKAVLYNDSGIVESMQKPHAIMIEEGKCITPAAKLGIRFLGGVAVIIVLIAIGLIGALSVYLWYSRGSVGFNKYIDGDKVSVTVTNNTPRTIRDVVIEDVIPTGAEIHVHTLNALRKQNTLIWEVGALPPSDSATLEYRVRGGHAVNQAALKWHKGAKTLV